MFGTMALLAQAAQAAPAQAGDRSVFETFVLGGGWIGGIIIVLSFAMVGLAILYFLQIRRTAINPRPLHRQIKGLFDNKQYREALDLTANEPSLLSGMLHAALKEASHGYASMERAVEEISEQRTTKMLRNVEWLNLIGNVAPMLGLFGTVYGMIGAFFDIVKAGGMPEPAMLAKNIGIALVTTFQGLFVAIPALGLYSTLRYRIDSLTSDAIIAAQELISTFRPAAKG